MLPLSHLRWHEQGSVCVGEGRRSVQQRATQQQSHEQAIRGTGRPLSVANAQSSVRLLVLILCQAEDCKRAHLLHICEPKPASHAGSPPSLSAADEQTPPTLGAAYEQTPPTSRIACAMALPCLVPPSRHCFLKTHYPCPHWVQHMSRPRAPRAPLARWRCPAATQAAPRGD